MTVGNDRSAFAFERPSMHIPAETRKVVRCFAALPPTIISASLRTPLRIGSTALGTRVRHKIRGPRAVIHGFLQPAVDCRRSSRPRIRILRRHLCQSESAPVGFQYTTSWAYRSVQRSKSLGAPVMPVQSALQPVEECWSPDRPYSWGMRCLRQSDCSAQPWLLRAASSACGSF
ncbi:hypothetical protein GY45DRAFT_1323168, partial [Cubamyces sp. BRFM 1775]